MSCTLALLRGHCHVLADIPFVRGSKSTGFVHDPLHEVILARRYRPTTPKAIDLQLNPAARGGQDYGHGNERLSIDVLSLLVSPMVRPDRPPVNF
jgi:hypothetical protein